MMDLSYNSPAGVCMITKLLRVTWHSWVLRSGDGADELGGPVWGQDRREPMAFMEDCQTNRHGQCLPRLAWERACHVCARNWQAPLLATACSF